jgi:histidinol-phosphate/aromatic aminotransferase/cobyric acid decarboxylase-like protein
MKSEKQILIKAYHGIGNLDDCLRVTTGETELMDVFIKALLELDQ